ncbi:cytochrome c-type biogenesis protein [Acidomonas methanolica]|uniref:Cytochrome c-type biogenesis protein n=1 Tax=Acidomonas methanolica NBRC 104435 TaxID=1231351 RepID=A0A023D2W5_ACIMT|nr:cytochrome c-type biogenesis protein CcmH [Acidomonas methanolica]TCS27423.1 cytochrome c-type biogenesis protein CcmH [Acidomonas methanolica]GAJ28095.1 cytochrome c biogenesis protein CycL/CcmH [Acidomonas methanolica NBRC 104435]GEK98669.1 cytochrome c-type biogenesis protein CcmH [Acidomonas methanolica NBRC 104435]
MRRARLAWMAAGMFCLAAPAFAVDDPSEMLPDARQEQRAEAIGAQLRCLVCQNESIEDSSADLARDLRHVVREHVAKGESDQQIIDWMTRRYGEFIRLKPRLSAATVMLWGMPALALIAGLAIAGAVLLRRPKAVPPLSEEERRRLAELSPSTGND